MANNNICFSAVSMDNLFLIVSIGDTDYMYMYTDDGGGGICVNFFRVTLCFLFKIWIQQYKPVIFYQACIRIPPPLYDNTPFIPSS